MGRLGEKHKKLHKKCGILHNDEIKEGPKVVKKSCIQIIQILNIEYYEPSLHSDDLCLNEPFPQIID